jgi:predicted transcriptional regulator of viral defense system
VVASGQRGLVTTAQLHEAGLTDRDINYRVATGRLHPRFKGVYMVGHRAITRDAWFLAATLAVGPDSGLGYYSACQHYEMWDDEVGEVHIVVPRRAQHRDRIRIHSVQSAPRFREVRGVRVVEPALAVLQFASVVRDVWEIRRVAREAQFRELVTHEELLAVASDGVRVRGAYGLH